MRIVIAGSRTIEDMDIVFEAITEGVVALDIADQSLMVVSGGAPGVDQIAEEWARKKQIPFYVIPAQWGKLGKRAGYLRNERMGDIGDVLVAVWDGHSKGTQHMINIMRGLNKPVHVHNTRRLDPALESDS